MSETAQLSLFRPSAGVRVTRTYSDTSPVTIYRGDCRSLLKTIPDGVAGLVVTSPPYNIGKEYEKRIDLKAYVEQQTEVIAECYRVLSNSGSICWQVGNHVASGYIVPLDSLLYPVFANLGLRMRNRIVWTFDHGLHCKNRFSGRYEVVMWFTKSDDYVFNLDPVRVPQKYPGKKYFKGPRAGEYSCNPLGKNPGDVWVIPNVKHNHVEKTDHPCQFPVELIERLVLGMTNAGSLVIDPFLGSGTSGVAALRHGRRFAGADNCEKYVLLSEERIHAEAEGTLRTRPMGAEVYQPRPNDTIARNPFTQPES